MNQSKVIALRIVHGLAALYFLACLGYLYYAAFFNHFGFVLLVAVLSLAAEAVAVFVFNNGDCPLIHIQRRIGDDKPFFELILPKRIAKKAIPFFATITWIAVGLLAIRLCMNILS